MKTLGSLPRKVKVSTHTHTIHTFASTSKCSETTNNISQTTIEDGERKCVSRNWNKIISKAWNSALIFVIKGQERPCELYRS